jgi:hypothetical protein
MTRILVAATLVVAACGGTDPEPAAQTFSIAGCTEQQVGTCIDFPEGSITCRAWQLQAGLPISWVWAGSDSACAPADCRMIGNRPTSDNDQFLAICP